MEPKRKPLAPRGGNDNVTTPGHIAKRIVQHFRPSGLICEPCYGGGTFSTAIVSYHPNRTISGFEINEDLPVPPGVRREGLDFLAYRPYRYAKKWDWIVTNPPWSQFRNFLIQSMLTADNVVFLCLVNAWFMRARQDDIQKSGFGLVEILEIKQPPKPWPQTGFMLGAGWIRRGWTGSTTITRDQSAL